MAKNSKLINDQIAEINELFGPPPVLSTESEEAYFGIMARLLKDIAPATFLELMSVKHLTDIAWEIKRCSRHKSLLIQRRFEKFEIDLKKLVARRRADLDREHQLRDEVPATEADRRSILEDTFESSASDVREICEKAPKEIDHAQALEWGIKYYGALDELIGRSLARQNDILQQVEWYREALGYHTREASDDPLGLVRDQAAPEPKEVASPPIDPAEEKAQ